MTRAEFLSILHERLRGLPAPEIEELMDDYDSHFAEGLAAGRSEAEIAAALGDPARLARELRAEAGLRRWESARTPANFYAAMISFMALILTPEAPLKTWLTALDEQLSRCIEFFADRPVVVDLVPLLEADKNNYRAILGMLKTVTGKPVQNAP